MPARKKDIAPAQWTGFWNALDMAVPKRQRFLKRYNPVSQDVTPLRRAGVERAAIDRIRRLLSSYQDPILFHMFGRFFRSDPYTIQTWTHAGNPTEAFVSLYNIFVRLSLPQLRKRFGELRLLSELNRKGEGWRYEIRYRQGRRMSDLRGTQFTRRLNFYDPNAKYVFQNAFEFDGARIVAIKKRSGNREVFKFVTLRKTGNKVEAKVAADSKKEHVLIRRALGDYFSSYVDSPQDAADLAPLQNFMRTGTSEHFALVGVSYFQDDYLISIKPRFNHQLSVAEHGAFRDYLREHNPEQVVVQMRLVHKGEAGRVPVFVDLRSSMNSNLIGAIIFDLRDRALRPYERQLLVTDFQKDFGFDLGSFVSYDDLSNAEIYKRLLQTVGRRSSDMELRSDRALGIYKKLIAEGLIDQKFATRDEPAHCVNTSCSIRYSLQRHRQYCHSCQERLLAGPSIIHPAVNERKTAQYIANRLEKLGYASRSLSKTLLGRRYYVASVGVGNTSVAIVSLTTALNENQMELLRLRLPNALVLTARDNTGDYRRNDVECRPLHEFVSLLEQRQDQAVNEMIRDVAQNGTTRMHSYARDAAKRYANNAFYQAKNREGKNLGAEFFEVDTYLLLAYMFRNSVWLGATQRGVPVPDGISAFPILNPKGKGCLLWDSKYSDGNVNLGPQEKNQTYISAAKKNDTIKRNGGLGGFVFVTNQPAPRTFEKRYRRLGGPRKPKIAYLTAAQLLRIFHHFREHENAILNDVQCHSIFADSMETLFISTRGGNKTFIVNDDGLNNILSENKTGYERFRTPVVNA